MKKILIGEIVKPQGIKGEVKVKPFVNNPVEFLSIKQVYIGVEPVMRDVLNSDVRQGFAYLTISGIDSINLAEAYRNKQLFVDYDEAQKNHDGEVFISDIIGFDVVFDDGKKLGKLDDVDNFGSKDVFFVSGKINASFPNVEGVLLNIDHEKKIITVSKSKFNEVGMYEN